MARIVFELDIDATRKEIVEALDTQPGIAGWWTEDVTTSGGSGSQMTLGFPGRAPVPFELRVDEVNERSVRWSSVGGVPAPLGRHPDHLDPDLQARRHGHHGALQP